MLPRQNLSKANASETTTESSHNGVKTPPANRLKKIVSVLGNRGLGEAIQPKSRISEPGDPQEHDANRVADQVMSMDPDTRGATRSSLADHSAIHNSQGNGRRLSPSVRNFFETRFDHNLSHVRIHTGAEAAEASRETDARAFTAGSGVVFGAGEYQPDSYEGRRLIAHELAHVVQGARHGNSSQIMRQPSGAKAEPETKNDPPASPPKTSPEPVRPESKVDWKFSDLLIYPLFVDVFKDVILKRLTDKERKEFGLK